MSKKGFAFVELMVVVAILGIIAAVAIPNFQRFRECSRNPAKCKKENAQSRAPMDTYEEKVYCEDGFLYVQVYRNGEKKQKYPARTDAGYQTCNN